MNQPTPQDLLEARLTAYALDELTGEERAQVERLLAEGTPQAAAALSEIARIREVGTQLSRDLARELGDGPAPALTPAQRAAISRAASPARPLPILRWSLAAACAALAAAVMVAVLVPGGAPEAQPVAKSAPHPLAEEAAGLGGRKRDHAASSPPAALTARSEDAKQEAQLQAPAVARRELRDGIDAPAKSAATLAETNQPFGKREHTVGADAAVASAKPAALAAVSALDRARAIDEQSAGQRPAAAPAPVAVAAAAPPAAAAASPPHVGGEADAAPPFYAAKTATVKGRQGALAAGAPAAVPLSGGAAADAVTRLADAPAAGPALIIAERKKSVQNGLSTGKDVGAGADKEAAATARPAGAVAAPGILAANAATPAADEMISTSTAATVQVPVDARMQSFDSVRRCLAAGRLPPPELVQIGELINAATAVQRPAQNGEPATISIAAGSCPWQPDHQLLGIVIAARRVAVAPRPPLNLVVLVDDSAAMRGEDRLPLIRPGLAKLVQGLAEADRLALVTYGARARLVIPGTTAPDAGAALAAISGIAAASDAPGADVTAGLALAMTTLQRNHRAGSRDEVLLCSAGAPPGDQALADQLRGLAADGVGLQLMAVGHDHPEDGALERLAALGHGSFTYLATAAQAEEALVGIAGPREVVARQVLAEVAFNAAEVASYRLLGSGRMSPRRPADGAGTGELLAGQAVTLLFELARAPEHAEPRLRSEVLDSAALPALVSVLLSYRLADGQPGLPIAARLGVAEAAGQDRGQLALAAAVAEFALALRHPDDRRYRFERMLLEAQGERSAANAEPVRRAALIDLITRAAALAAAGDGR